MDDFVCEPLVPQRGSADVAAMARGEAGLPARFTWRGQPHAVAVVLRTWKTSTRERGELYLRRHWFELRTTTGLRMTVYCDRQAKNAKHPARRWWVYSVQEPPAAGPTA